MKKIFIILIISSLTLLMGCSPTINDYQGTKPVLNLQDYLNGNISGNGIIQDWRGKVIRQFTFTGHAYWKDNNGTFNEQITYSDGEIDKRVWHLTKLSTNHYKGVADDTVGSADIRVAGNSMNWRYSLNVKTDNGIIKLNFDDWMYLLNNKLILNKNQFSKFGIDVGSLTMVLRKS